MRPWEPSGREGTGGEKTSPLQRTHTPEHWLPAACMTRSSLWPFHVVPMYVARAEGDQGSPGGESVSLQSHHCSEALG